MGRTNAAESRRKPARTHRRTRLQVDSLEGRRLLSAQIVNLPSSQTVAILGTAVSDLGVVAQKGSNVVVLAKSAGDASATIQSFPASSVKHVVFLGGGGNDIFINLSAIPAIAGGGDGNDLLIGGPGNDSLDGGPGNDIIIDLQGDNTVQGGDGNDVIVTGGGNDTIDAGAGNDWVFAGGGTNAIQGGDGNDILVGGPGNDTINGGAGSDLILGGGGINSLYGGDGNDWIVGGSGVNFLYGQGGNDFLVGGAGGNVLDGGDGNDLLVGGTGLNVFNGGAGNNLLFGKAAYIYSSPGGNNLQRPAPFNAVQLATGSGTDPLTAWYQQFAQTQVSPLPLVSTSAYAFNSLTTASGSEELLASNINNGILSGTDGYFQDLKAMGLTNVVTSVTHDTALNGGYSSQELQNALNDVGLSTSDLQRLNH
jgi:Ca2+-binding RTX toxin-like protein